MRGQWVKKTKNSDGETTKQTYVCMGNGLDVYTVLCIDEGGGETT